MNRLANPPGRIGRKLVAASPVELVYGSDQSEDAFLDEIDQCQPPVLITAGYRDDQPEIGVDHPVPRRLVAALDALREVDLLGSAQKRKPAELVEKDADGIDGRQRELAVGVMRGGRAFRTTVVAHVDAM